MLFEFKILKYNHVFTVFHTLTRLYFICLAVNELVPGSKFIKIFPQGGIPKLKYVYPIFTITSGSTLSLLHVFSTGEDAVLDSSGLWLNQESSLIAAEIRKGGSVRSQLVEYKEVLGNTCEELWSFCVEKSNKDI